MPRKYLLEISTDTPESIAECYVSGIGLDFAFAVDGKLVKAAKYILAIHSPVFKAMLENEWKDSRENRIDITDCSYETMEAFVKVLHGIKLELTDIQLALEMMMVVDKYQVPRLKDQAECFVEARLNQKNVIDSFKYAAEVELTSVKQLAIDFIVSKRYDQLDDLVNIDKLPAKLWKLVAEKMRSRYD